MYCVKGPNTLKGTWQVKAIVTSRTKINSLKSRFICVLLYSRWCGRGESVAREDQSQSPLHLLRGWVSVRELLKIVLYSSSCCLFMLFTICVNVYSQRFPRPVCKSCSVWLNVAKLCACVLIVCILTCGYGALRLCVLWAQCVSFVLCDLGLHLSECRVRFKVVLERLREQGTDFTKLYS